MTEVINSSGSGAGETSRRDGAMPLFLALVRHGHSQGQQAAEAEKAGDLSHFTEEYRHTPSSSWNLTHRGVRQARFTAAWMLRHVINTTAFPHGQFDRGYFSPYQRARQTMGAMLKTGLVQLAAPNDRLLPNIYRANHDLRLRELDFGEVSTIPRQEFHTKYPASVWARKIDPLFGRNPGGESIADVVDRGRDFMGALNRAHERGLDSALVVGHGRQIRGMQLAFEGIDPLNWSEYDRANEIKNCQVVLYSRNDPKTGEVQSTFRWTASVCPWESEEVFHAGPQWREFSAPTTVTAEQCVDGIPQEWWDEPLGPVSDLA